MGNIHVLPLAGVDCGGLKRLTCELSSALEAGDELGSRVSHIWTSARALEGMSDLLEVQINELAAVEHATELGYRRRSRHSDSSCTKSASCREWRQTFPRRLKSIPSTLQDLTSE